MVWLMTEPVGVLARIAWLGGGLQPVGKFGFGLQQTLTQSHGKIGYLLSGLKLTADKQVNSRKPRHTAIAEWCSHEIERKTYKGMRRRKLQHQLPQHTSNKKEGK